jgi:hypothetical protein
MAIRKTVAGTFEVDFRDQHKKRIQKTFDTHRDAAAFHKEALAQVAKREYVKPSKKTVREEADDWDARKADGKYRRASLVDWKNHVENYIKPELGELELQDIDVEKVEEVASQWAKKVSPKMVNKVLTTLTAVWRLPSGTSASRITWQRRPSG